MRFNKFFLFLATFLSITLFTSCSSSKIMGDENGVFASIQRGPCFGKCPVYSMQVYTDGRLVYEGTRFAKKLGTYHKTLTATELKELDKVIKSANFFTFDSIYESEIPDLSGITIYHSNGKEQKSVFGKENRPPALMQIQYALERIVESDGWKLIKAAPVETSEEVIDTREKKVETTIFSEIIIEPTTGTLAKFLQDFTDKSLYLSDRITEDGRLWLVKYDMSKYKPEEMLALIKADARIKSAEFNKRLETRD
ncbi:MAG: hypothetical protein IPL23_10115 [Saprospiraceae bacterium]|nr:hypothetical protein [Saprospiraceae bacterium]